MEVLLNNQESCVINGGKTSKRGTQQGDPISAYLFTYLFYFINVLEEVFKL